jgi:hypothetical protein
MARLCAMRKTRVSSAHPREPEPGNPAPLTDSPLRNDICLSWMPVASLMAMLPLRADPLIASPGSTSRAQVACPIESALVQGAAAAAPCAGG